jgi:hypothetical protein
MFFNRFNQRFQVGVIAGLGYITNLSIFHQYAYITITSRISIVTYGCGKNKIGASCSLIPYFSIAFLVSCATNAASGSSLVMSTW